MQDSSPAFTVRTGGNKADNWFLRQCPKVLNLLCPTAYPPREPHRDNAIDVYIGGDYMDINLHRTRQMESIFKEKPELLQRGEEKAWLDQMTSGCRPSALMRSSFGEATLTGRTTERRMVIMWLSRADLS